VEEGGRPAGASVRGVVTRWSGHGQYTMPIYTKRAAQKSRI